LNVSEDEAEALLDALRPTRARTFSQAFPGTAIGAAAGPSQLFPPPTFSAIPSSNPASQLLPPAPFGAPALTQSASALFSGFPGTQATAPDPTQPGAIPAPPTPFSFHCAPLDALLDGGLPRGHILELSGPPQTPRDAVALGAVRSALAAGGAVLVVDTQNIIAPRDLKNLLSSAHLALPQPWPLLTLHRMRGRRRGMGAACALQEGAVTPGTAHPPAEPASDVLAGADHLRVLVHAAPHAGSRRRRRRLRICSSPIQHRLTIWR
jgi:hypothetical protein